jgi:PPOX class probable F420-dependent enzyme
VIERFAAAPVARLATVRQDGRPHVVPIVFAVDGETLYTAVDGKPKSSARLQRLANIEANPRVSILADHYTEDWSQLWWVRADGVARVWFDGPECERGLELLRSKYTQYREVALDGPVIAVAVENWAWWPQFE